MLRRHPAYFMLSGTIFSAIQNASISVKFKEFVDGHLVWALSTDEGEDVRPKGTARRGRGGTKWRLCPTAHCLMCQFETWPRMSIREMCSWIHLWICLHHLHADLDDDLESRQEPSLTAAAHTPALQSFAPKDKRCSTTNGRWHFQTLLIRSHFFLELQKMYQRHSLGNGT